MYGYSVYKYHNRITYNRWFDFFFSLLFSFLVCDMIALNVWNGKYHITLSNSHFTQKNKNVYSWVNVGVLGNDEIIFWFFCEIGLKYNMWS